MVRICVHFSPTATKLGKLEPMLVKPIISNNRCNGLHIVNDRNRALGKELHYDPLHSYIIE